MNNTNTDEGTGPVPAAIALLMNLLCRQNGGVGAGQMSQEQQPGFVAAATNEALPTMHQTSAVNLNQTSHQMSQSQANLIQVNANQINQNQINPNQVNPNQINHNQINHNQVNHNQVNHNQVNRNQVNQNQVYQNQFSRNEMSFGQGNQNLVNSSQMNLSQATQSQPNQNNLQQAQSNELLLNGNGIVQNWLNGGIQNQSGRGTAFFHTGQTAAEQSESQSQASNLLQSLKLNSCVGSYQQNNTQAAPPQNALQNLVQPAADSVSIPELVPKKASEKEGKKSATPSTDIAKNKPSAKTSDTSVIRLPSPASDVRRFPCRARGMPLDHNAKTAFYDVPDSTDHGKELICAHLLCQTQGVKFQFCRYCDRPVAKRNFRNRHMHIDQAYPDDGSILATVEEFSRKRRLNDLASPSLDVHVAKTSRASGIGDSAIVSVGTRDFSAYSSVRKSAKGSRVNDMVKRKKNSANGSKVIPKEEEEEEDNSVLPLNKKSNSTASDWMALLEERPSCDNNQATVEWLDAVLNTSGREQTPSGRGKKICFRDIAIEYLIKEKK